MSTQDQLNELQQTLSGMPSLAVAVSGGIDSLTLAVAAHRLRPRDVEVFHAVSAAVPMEATRRVESMAASEAWPLHLIDARELDREHYAANPVNRCLYCKRSLYTTIAEHTHAQIVSGANLDDLGDYRPGLEAAREANVRHPYIEAQIDKPSVRALARRLGLGILAELPSSPCLSSRVETGITIVAPMLRRIDSAERYLRDVLGATTVRCRVRGNGLVVELDPSVLGVISDDLRLQLATSVLELFGPVTAGTPMPIFVPYRRGSAFVGPRQ